MGFWTNEPVLFAFLVPHQLGAWQFCKNVSEQHRFWHRCSFGVIRHGIHVETDKELVCIVIVCEPFNVIHNPIDWSIRPAGSNNDNDVKLYASGGDACMYVRQVARVVICHDAKLVDNLSKHLKHVSIHHLLVFVCADRRYHNDEFLVTMM